jgi:hypothetical protein
MRLGASCSARSGPDLPSPGLAHSCEASLRTRRGSGTVRTWESPRASPSAAVTYTKSHPRNGWFSPLPRSQRHEAHHGRVRAGSRRGIDGTQTMAERRRIKQGPPEHRLHEDPSTPSRLPHANGTVSPLPEDEVLGSPVDFGDVRAPCGVGSFRRAEALSEA